MQETWIGSPSQEDPLEEDTATHSNISPRESHGQRSLAGCGPLGLTELDTTEATKQHQQQSFVIAFLPRIKSLLTSWLQSPSSVTFETKNSLSLFLLFSHLFAMK